MNEFVLFTTANIWGGFFFVFFLFFSFVQIQINYWAGKRQTNL